MMKQRNKTRNTKTGRTVGGYKVLGTTRDGVRILKPKGKPDSFSVVRLRKAIAAVDAETQTAG